MCHECVKIDEKIKRYRKLATLMPDEATQKGIDDLIAKLEAQKVALHPEQH